MNKTKWTPEREAWMAAHYQKGESRQDVLDALCVLPGTSIGPNDIGTYLHEVKLKLDPEARKRQQSEAGRRGAAALVAAKAAAAAIASGAVSPIASPMVREPLAAVPLTFTRDGTVSIAALVEAQADRDAALVTSTAHDAAMWGLHNGATSAKLSDINARRAELLLPGFTLIPERKTDKPLPYSRPGYR